MTSKIIAVCISKSKGTRKDIIQEAIVKEKFGIVGDAHADSRWHRQVSLLSIESINKMRNSGYDVGPGDFAENLTCEGINLISLPIGTKVQVGEKVLLNISQIGKECHTGCTIFKTTGKCIMPKEGVFAKVLIGGKIKVGDEIKIRND